MKRKLIHNSEPKVSYLQIIGFLFILFGLAYLVIEQVQGKLISETIAIDFFIITLGIAFAFPDLLRDSNKGLSTMRIVVFMMINVICMLLLKIGWDSKSLADIHLDQYWMGVIAFIFGAKATQSFFESKIAAVNAQASSQVQQSAASQSAANSAELDGCGVQPVILTADETLPQSEGGMA